MRNCQNCTSIKLAQCWTILRESCIEKYIYFYNFQLYIVNRVNNTICLTRALVPRPLGEYNVMWTIPLLGLCFLLVHKPATPHLYGRFLLSSFTYASLGLRLCFQLFKNCAWFKGLCTNIKETVAATPFWRADRATGFTSWQPAQNCSTVPSSKRNPLTRAGAGLQSLASC